MAVMSALARASEAATVIGLALVRCRTEPVRVIVTPETEARPVLMFSAISAALILTSVTTLPATITAAVAVVTSTVVPLTVTLYFWP